MTFENRHLGTLASGREVYECSAQWERDQLAAEQQHSNGHAADPYADVPSPDGPPDDKGGNEAFVPCGPFVSTDQPVPLTRSVEVPPFPSESLPPAVADMVAAVAVATQTDPAMAGTAALAVVSACTGGHAEVEVRPGWREPLCLYTATVAAPGERKSSVMRTMAAPILAVERELVDKGAAARLEAATRKEVATKEAEQERRAAANASAAERDRALADAIGAAAFAEGITVPPVARLVADDVTPEAAGSLLAEQGGRLAILSAEGGILDIIAGRYSQKANLDVWLKGHAGDMVKVDRKGREAEYIPRPALTLGVMIQPSVLDAIAANREFRGRGLLARFLYALPASKVGRRAIAPPPVPGETAHEYEAAISALAAGMAEWVGDPAILVLTSDAQEAIKEVERRIEPMLAPDAELGSLADWGAKYVGAVARIAGMIHLAEHGPDLGPRKPVEADTIDRAERIGSYYVACAVNVFHRMGSDQTTAAATYLLERIIATGESELTERDMLRTAKRFRTVAELRPVVSMLVDHGYVIRVDDAPKPTGGRPASPRYRVADYRTKGTQGTKA